MTALIVVLVVWLLDRRNEPRCTGCGKTRRDAHWSCTDFA